MEELEKAFSLDNTDARILMELDQLYNKLGRPFIDRLMRLEEFDEAVRYRDDLYLEKVKLYNLLGNHEIALDLLMKRKFHPWEGGEGKVTGQYLFSHIEIAKKANLQKRNKQHCNYLGGVPGDGTEIQSQESLNTVLTADPYHTGCIVHMAMCS